MQIRLETHSQSSVRIMSPASILLPSKLIMIQGSNDKCGGALVGIGSASTYVDGAIN